MRKTTFEATLHEAHDGIDVCIGPCGEDDDVIVAAGVTPDTARGLKQSLDLWVDAAVEKDRRYGDHMQRRYHEIVHENRRLRTILAALARAGVGTGALVEVYVDEINRTHAGVVVCRADADEAQFMRDARAAIEKLAAVLGGKSKDVGEPVRTGVTAEDKKT